MSAESLGEVVLLDASARPAGTMDKLAAHQGAHRHLAFSVMLFDDAGRVLLQRRADTKYHFAGRWSNTCCSHPRPGETVVAAGCRRVREELGIEVADLAVHGAFWYRARDRASGLVEHEYDVVLTGQVPAGPRRSRTYDPAEVSATMWLSLDDLGLAMRDTPRQFTPWFAQALEIATGPVAPPAAPGVPLR